MAAPPNAPIAAPLSVRCSVVVMLAHPPTPSAAAIVKIASLRFIDQPLIRDCRNRLVHMRLDH